MRVPLPRVPARVSYPEVPRDAYNPHLKGNHFFSTATGCYLERDQLALVAQSSQRTSPASSSPGSPTSFITTPDAAASAVTSPPAVDTAASSTASAAPSSAAAVLVDAQGNSLLFPHAAVATASTTATATAFPVHLPPLPDSHKLQSPSAEIEGTARPLSPKLNN